MSDAKKTLFTIVMRRKKYDINLSHIRYVIRKHTRNKSS